VCVSCAGYSCYSLAIVSTGAALVVVVVVAVVVSGVAVVVG